MLLGSNMKHSFEWPWATQQPVISVVPPWNSDMYTISKVLLSGYLTVNNTATFLLSLSKLAYMNASFQYLPVCLLCKPTQASIQPPNGWLPQIYWYKKSKPRWLPAHHHQVMNWWLARMQDSAALGINWTHYLSKSWLRFLIGLVAWKIHHLGRRTCFLYVWPMCPPDGER